MTEAAFSDFITENALRQIQEAANKPGAIRPIDRFEETKILERVQELEKQVKELKAFLVV